MGTNRRLRRGYMRAEKGPRRKTHARMDTHTHGRSTRTFFHPSEFRRCALRSSARGIDVRSMAASERRRSLNISIRERPSSARRDPGRESSDSFMSHRTRYQSRRRHALHPLMPDESNDEEWSARAYQRKSNYPNRMEFNSSRSSVGTTPGEQRKKTVKGAVGGAN